MNRSIIEMTFYHSKHMVIIFGITLEDWKLFENKYSMKNYASAIIICINKETQLIISPNIFFIFFKLYLSYYDKYCLKN